MSGEVEVAYSAGRRNGHVRAVPARDVGDLLGVGGDDDALEARRSGAPSRSRRRGAGAPRAAARSSPAHAPSRIARGRTRPRAARSPQPGRRASSVSVGHGHAEPLGSPQDAADDRVELGAPSGGDVPRGGRRRLVGHLVDDRPLRRRRAAATPSASATAHASAIAFWRRGRQLGSLRSSPTVRPDAAVAAASGAIRAALCQRTRFSSCPTRTSSRAWRSKFGGALEVPARQLVGRHRDHGRGRRLDDLHPAGAIRLEVGDAARGDPAGEPRSRAAPCARARSAAARTTPVRDRRRGRLARAPPRARAPSP